MVMHGRWRVLIVNGGRVGARLLHAVVNDAAGLWDRRTATYAVVLHFDDMW